MSSHGVWGWNHPLAGVQHLQPMPDPTRGRCTKWVIRRLDGDQWVYWIDQARGYTPDLGKATWYDKKPNAMGDEQTAEVEIEVSLV
jgi:hypothetical protein